jgi:hypothetical protein
MSFVPLPTLRDLRDLQPTLVDHMKLRAAAALIAAMSHKESATSSENEDPFMVHFSKNTLSRSV